MSIRGIAFDLEGTVIDVEAAHHHGHLAAASEFGLKMSLDAAYAKLPHIIGGPDEKVCEDIHALLDQSMRARVNVEEILARDRLHYERLLWDSPIEPRPGFLDFCEAVRSAGLKVTIGSLTPAKQAVLLLERSGLAANFGPHSVVLREHVEKPKPAPDVFLKTAAIMAVAPREQLIFEDSPRGVTAALAAGSRAIGMPVILRGNLVGALVDAGACRIFFDWRDINALALIGTLNSE